MRKILVRWLAKVAAKFRCKSDTLHMCVQLIDLMLLDHGATFNKKNFQLLGVSCLFISCKYNEIYSMEACKYVEVCEGIYTVGEIFEMEGFVLGALNFNLQIPTAHQFSSHILNSSRMPKQHCYIVKTLLDMSIFDFETFNTLRKNDMAIGIIYFVAKLYQLEEVKANLSPFKNRINSEDLKKCFNVAANLFKKSQIATTH